METSVNQRIKSVVEYKKMNNNSFSKLINFTPQTLHNITSGKMHKPSYEVLESIISACPDINPVWLITGKGEMIESNIKADKKESLSSQIEEEYRTTIEKLNNNVDRLLKMLEREQEECLRLTEALGKP